MRDSICRVNNANQLVWSIKKNDYSSAKSFKSLRSNAPCFPFIYIYIYMYLWSSFFQCEFLTIMLVSHPLLCKP